MSTTSSMVLGIALPPGADTLAQSLEATLCDTIALAVVDALPASKLVEFEAVLSGGDEHDIGAFLETYVPRARDVIRDALGDAKEDLALLAGAP